VYIGGTIVQEPIGTPYPYLALRHETGLIHNAFWHPQQTGRDIIRLFVLSVIQIKAGLSAVHDDKAQQEYLLANLAGVLVWLLAETAGINTVSRAL
tara:strand:+ start:74 stop:361 length:288 start_codon:yes stop_codon:yes gene_type:complete